MAAASLPGRSLDSHKHYLRALFGGNIDITVLNGAATSSDAAVGRCVCVGTQAERESGRSGDRRD
jgi:hypothetical protein